MHQTCSDLLSESKSFKVWVSHICLKPIKQHQNHSFFKWMPSFGKHYNTPFVTKSLSKYVPLTSWQLSNQQHAEHEQCKHQASIWWAGKPKTVPQWWQPTHLSVWQKATTYLRHVSIACLSFITALTKETDDEEEHLLTFIALLLWLRIIAFFIESFHVWLCKFYLWLLGSLSLCKQSCGIRLLLSVLRIIMPALFQAELTLSLLLHFEQSFCDFCFDSQLAGFSKLPFANQSVFIGCFNCNLDLIFCCIKNCKVSTDLGFALMEDFMTPSWKLLRGGVRRLVKY